MTIKATSSCQPAQDFISNQDHAKFGGRLLLDPSQVFTQNAWDHAEWDDEQEERAQMLISKQLEHPVDAQLALDLMENAGKQWDEFYSSHDDKFFMDRKWLRIEFPELFERPENLTDSTFTLMEVGCGAGNALFPIYQYHKANEQADQKTSIYGCDFSQTAVDICQRHEFHTKASDDQSITQCYTFQHDLTQEFPSQGHEPERGSLDVILAVFVLSAIPPNKLQQTVKSLFEMLKPGGLLLFRDYGRNDMSQLRFKKSRIIAPNHYVRGDGTQVCYFSSEQLDSVFTSAGFEVLQNAVDRRLIVNRKKQVKMYRVWLQCKLRKPIINSK